MSPLKFTFVAALLSGLLLSGCKDDDAPTDGGRQSKVVPMTNPVLYITTDGGSGIDSKEHYVGCTLRLDGRQVYDDYQTPSGACDSIRGRGNSTWLWYPKKPYKIKLDRKASLCGIGQGKKYVLLANYRDPTRMMNAVVFDMASYMGLPYTNSNRFVEVYVDGDYAGLYQLTEQIEQGKNRVAVDATSGILLSLDYDDGPDLCPDAGNNFCSEVFNSSYSWWGLPVCIKYPKEPTAQQLADIKAEFTRLEQAIDAKNYTALKAMCDVRSMMDFLIIQELTRNVELVTPRSMYLFRDADRMWRFGPMWDFDGGFGYDWGERHNYFTSQSWMMGPRGTLDIPDFFDRMFDNAAFVADYRARWDEIGEEALEFALDKMECRLDTLAEAIERDEATWQIGRDCRDECDRMAEWLRTRADRYTAYLKTF